MLGFCRIAAAIAFAGAGLVSLPATAADNEFRIDYSERDGRAVIRHGDEIVATSKFEVEPRYDRVRQRVMRRGWRHGGCDPVVLQLFGVCEQYGGGFAVYAYAPRRRAPAEDRTITANSLELLPLGADFLGAGGAKTGEEIDTLATGSIKEIPYNPRLDQWQIYYRAKGRFETSPAPFVSTAKLWRAVDGSETARTEIVASAAVAARAPIRIAISPISRTELIAWHQNLLNKLGYAAGEPDGVLGPQTRTAIARFEVGMGFYPSGALNGRVSAMLHRAAGATEPQGGRIVVTSGGSVVHEAAVGIKGNGEFGTHVLHLDGEQGWQLLALAGADADLSRSVFGTPAKSQQEAALGALARIDMSPETASRIAELARPGSILTIGGNPEPQSSPPNI